MKKPKIPYEYERYDTDSKNLSKILSKYEVEIIPNVINQKECNNMKIGQY
jgi:hypothetical protein